jgi:predicted transcriptional regulator
MSNLDTAQRGIEASQVLDNPAYQQAMKSLKDEVYAAWKACPVRDKEGQVLLLQLAKLTDKFEGVLQGLVQSGRFAEHQLKLDNLRNESPARKMLRKISG